MLFGLLGCTVMGAPEKSMPEEPEDHSFPPLITDPGSMVWPSLDDLPSWRLMLQERVTDLHYRSYRNEQLLLRLIAMVEARGRSVDICMQQLAALADRLMQSAVQLGENGGLKWISLSLVALATVIWGGITLEWGDLHIMSSEAEHLGDE